MGLKREEELYLATRGAAEFDPAYTETESFPTTSSLEKYIYNNNKKQLKTDPLDKTIIMINHTVHMAA